MTREEAIDYLKWVRPQKPYTQDKKNLQTAIDMGIEALNEQRPHGKWMCISLLDDYVYIKCSECGQDTRLFRDSKNEFCCIRDVRDKIVACPYCGASMVKEG